jgi:hypothetical protein
MGERKRLVRESNGRHSTGMTLPDDARMTVAARIGGGGRYAVWWKRIGGLLWGWRVGWWWWQTYRM